MPVLETALGALLLGATLLDVFLTVLYARAGTSILARRLSHGVWSAFRALARHSGSRGPRVLSFGGPCVMAILLFAWALLLTVGSALIVHPALGHGIRASSGTTDHDFVTALYVGGSSMSIVGASAYEPQSAPYRLLFLFDSLVGVSVVSLTITYLMQVYDAVRARSSTALGLHLQSGETGDAAELVAAWGAGGSFQSGYSNLVDVANDITSLKESHHFFPVLFYFQFPDAHYSVARVALLALDATALMRAALDEREHGWIPRSAAGRELERGTDLLVHMLNGIFVSEEPGVSGADDLRAREAWRVRYLGALRILQDAGIATRAPPEAGLQAYLDARAHWDREVRCIAAGLGSRMDEIDPAGSAAAGRG